MTKFCSNCGKQLQYENAEICPDCREKLLPQPLDPTAQTSTSMNRQEIFGRAIPFFAAKAYAVQTQTDYVIAFESQNRDVNWIIFLVFCCFGIIGAIVYYYWFTHNHQVTVSLSGPTDIKVTAIGNTEQAKIDAAEFMRTLL